MNLLIVGNIFNQHVVNFSRKLKEKGFVMFGFSFYKQQPDESYKENPSFVKTWTVPSKYKSRIKNLVFKSFGTIYLFAKVKGKIDVVQFHYISFITLPLALISKIKRYKVSSFVYGSDFLRTNSVGKIILGFVFWLSDSIVCDSGTVRDKLIERFPSQRNKISCIYFGSIIIDDLVSSINTHKKTKNENSKYSIMCGYNGSEGQNHLQVLKSLIKFRDTVQIILPMTYGGMPDYIQSVKEFLDSNEMDYTILDTFIPNEKWETILMNTDIFIHMQKSDAFSSALAEHLLLGNIVINAEWLEYRDLDDNDVYYLTANFETLSDVVSEVIHNFGMYYEKNVGNCQKVIKLKSLNYCIENYWKPYFLGL